MMMTDRAHMQRALSLAVRGRGRVEPNPMVGCVLVRGDRVIGEGWHKRFGGPHAEVEALRDCHRRGNNPAGCDAYVTLEPCCHFGKTPPCTDALIAARVGRVIVAVADPFPQVAGKGIRTLRRAGIAVEVGMCRDEAREVNHTFFKRVATGLPWVIAKWAQTLDGRVTLGDGKNRWISNEQSRAYVHDLRGWMDAVIVGIGTVLADDPLLTARPTPQQGKGKPVIPRIARRVVIDPNLKIPMASRLVRSLPTPLTVAVRSTLLKKPSRKLLALRRRGVEIIALPAWKKNRSALSLEPLLRHLAEEHAAANVLVEGGPTLMGTLLMQQLADQVLIFIAPRTAGDAGLPAVRGLHNKSIGTLPPMRFRDAHRLGDDWLFDYRR